MNTFLITSIVGSVILTVLLNLIPVIFPNLAAKAQKKLAEHAQKSIEQHEDENRPRVKVFFPWRAMIVASVVLTMLVNFIGILSR